MTRPGTHGNDPLREPLDAAERELAERLARLGPHGEPPVAVDTRILAAAHAATNATNATPRRARRLPLTLGVAASLVLALGLAWQLRPLLDPPPPVESDSMDMAAARADGSKAAAPATEEAQERAAAGGDAAEARRAARVAAPDRAQAVTTDPAAPPPPSAPLRAQATVKPEAFPAPAAPLPPPPAPPPPAAPPSPSAPPAARATAPAAPAPIAETGAADAADAEMRRRAAESQRHLDHRKTGDAQAMHESTATADDASTPDDASLRQAQLDHIRVLRDAGHTAQARDELDAFLARWPGYPLPDDLQPLRR